ncbi:MAG TPA: hypothetical protein VGU61_08920 [Noviherbaspirillum sp.]|uniref:hypothetical protein n=1 Tax=Noviherbaspirillum sp. TaxID=1926288 RepID=UPI002DDC9DE3|nr:hypothetical protein [Noviherbaspirillum sp.]HEV2610374.1 hypothetical protein [Noviherbaspirillum sp.]
MKEVDAQMVLKLHKISGEPVANCNYLLTQTNGDYELALTILQRILAQRKTDQAGEGGGPGVLPGPDAPESTAQSAPDEPSAIEALENRVLQLELRLAQLTDTLVVVSDKLSQLLDKVSGDE